MAATFRSEDESSLETLPDRRWADGTVAQLRWTQASRAQIHRPQRVAALLLPMFAVSARSTNRFVRLVPQRFGLRLHCFATPYGQVAIWRERTSQNSSR